MRPQESSNGAKGDAVSVLVGLSDPTQEQALLDLLTHSTWHVVSADGGEDTIAKLRTEPVGVVVVSYRAGGPVSWRDVLEEARRLESPPAVIVTGDSTDEWSCTDVLNAGGYDFLPQPFEGREAFFIVSAAWRFWRQSNRKATTAAGFAA